MAATIVALIGGGMIFALRPGLAAHNTGTLASISFDAHKATPPKPPKRTVRRAIRHAVKGPASPRNVKSNATPVVAPTAAPLIVPPPVVAAPVAGTGKDASSGASNLRGAGQGAGGEGNGNGGGGTDEVQVSGSLDYGDIPRGLLGPGQQASVDVSYSVGTDGRVRNCRVTGPSGYPALDRRTCRLIERRYRFRPARDGKGRPVATTVTETQIWTYEKP